MDQYESMKRTSLRQGRLREGRSEGSRRQNHGAMNKNAIEGPVSGVSQHHMTKPNDSRHTVNGALAGWKLMLLSGETSLTCARDPGARRRVIVGVMGEESAEDIVAEGTEPGTEWGPLKRRNRKPQLRRRSKPGKDAPFCCARPRDDADRRSGRMANQRWRRIEGDSSPFVWPLARRYSGTA